MVTEVGTGVTGQGYRQGGCVSETTGVLEMFNSLIWAWVMVIHIGKILMSCTLKICALLLGEHYTSNKKKVTKKIGSHTVKNRKLGNISFCHLLSNSSISGKPKRW